MPCALSAWPCPLGSRRPWSVGIHTEALLPVATAAVGVVLTRSYRVREDQLFGWIFRGFCTPLIHKLRLMAVFAITIIHLGSMLVVR